MVDTPGHRFLVLRPRHQVQARFRKPIIQKILRLMSQYKILLFFGPPPDMRAFRPKLRNESLLGHIFRAFGICFTTLYVLVWTVHDELVHLQDSAWFGKKRFLLQPSSALKRGNYPRR